MPLRQIALRFEALFSRRLKAPLVLRLWRALWEIVKLILALLYFVLDELGFLVKWLASHFKPLELYFNAIKRLTFALRTRGLHSPDPMVRRITPYLALPFVLFPISLLLPAKVYFLHLILSRPIFALPALLLAKLFSAIFVKSTWDILRCVGRKNERIRRFDDKWLKLENWAKSTIHGVFARLAQTREYALAQQGMHRALAQLRPLAKRLVWQARSLLEGVLERARGWVRSRRMRPPRV